MNDLSSGQEKEKITEKTENKKRKKRSMMTIKFCFNYNLLKTWLALITVWYPPYHYDTTTDIQLNSSGEQNYTETMEKTLFQMQEFAA